MGFEHSFFGIPHLKKISASETLPFWTTVCPFWTHPYIYICYIILYYLYNNNILYIFTLNCFSVFIVSTPTPPARWRAWPWPCASGSLAKSSWAIAFSRDMAVAKKRWFIVDITNLVGGFNPSETWKSVGIILPNIWKNMFQTNQELVNGVYKPTYNLTTGRPHPVWRITILCKW